ncbi:MAG: LamG-like jellyroll fold domain-containing protein, partial [Angustibacter sp.]
MELGASSASSASPIEAQATALPRFASDRTVEAWIKPGDTYLRYFAGWGSPESGSGFSVGTDAGSVVVNSSAEVLRFPSSALADAGSWHHLVVTFGAGQVVVYLDGTSVGSKSFANPISTDPLGGLIVGNNVAEGNPWFGGLDELAIYPTALTPVQVAAHFARSGHGPPAAPTAVTATPGTNRLSVRWDSVVPLDGISHYRLQARQGNTVVAAVATTGKFAQLTGLPSGVAYTARVVAVNAYGASPEGVSAAATPTGSASTYVSSVLADQPDAYYRLGESAGVPVAVDSSGRNQTLSSARGGRDAAGAIRGDSDTAALSDAGEPLAAGRVAVPVGNDSRSVEAWIQPTEPYQGWLASWGSGGNRRAFAVSAHDSEVVVSAGTEQLKFLMGRNLDDAQWHHLVASYNGTNRTVTVYLDGTSLGAQSFNGPLNTPPGTVLHLAADTNGYTGFYGGMDELAIYPAALSAAEVSAHFAASGHGRPNAPASVSVTPQANAVAVTWPAPTAGDPVTGYLVAAVQAGVVRQARY